MTDAELIAATPSDAAALAELYRRHASVIHSWLARRAPRSEASELTAETFAQALLSMSRYRDPGDGSAGPWLQGIAGNLLKRYYERHRVEASARCRLGMPLCSYTDDPAEQLAERERAARLARPLQRALRRLSARQRDAVVLRVVNELSYAQIARRLDCTEGAARVRVTRALGTLAQSMCAEPV